jgi:hypothetical protein
VKFLSFSIWIRTSALLFILGPFVKNNLSFQEELELDRRTAFRQLRLIFSPVRPNLLARCIQHRMHLCLVLCSFLCKPVFAQGGPPYYTNDPGTPGNHNWEINLGYMPFYYPNTSVSHVPDVDINFGVGDRIQLTYENAWLRVQNPTTKYGLGQSNPGVKWRFYDAGESGLAISIFPQLFLNNPNDAVHRGITPASESFLLPAEFTHKIGPIDVDYEIGYQLVHKGPNGWITGLVIGHDFTRKLEGDFELYNTGTFHPSGNQPTFDIGGRYKFHKPVIFLFMAGRALEPARSNQSYFIGYFGIQLLLPPKSYPADLPENSEK